jgi:hypothetical protein
MEGTEGIPILLDDMEWLADQDSGLPSVRCSVRGSYPRDGGANQQAVATGLGLNFAGPVRS